MTAKNEKKENDRISFDFPNNFNFLSLPPYWFSQLIFQKLSPPPPITQFFQKFHSSPFIEWEGVEKKLWLLKHALVIVHWSWYFMEENEIERFIINLHERWLRIFYEDYNSCFSILKKEKFVYNCLYWPSNYSGIQCEENYFQLNDEWYSFYESI